MKSPLPTSCTHAPAWEIEGRSNIVIPAQAGIQKNRKIDTSLRWYDKQSIFPPLNINVTY